MTDRMAGRYVGLTQVMLDGVEYELDMDDSGSLLHLIDRTNDRMITIAVIELVLMILARRAGVSDKAKHLA